MREDEGRVGRPAIAEVRPASLAALEQVGHMHGSRSQTSAALVVVGKTPGTTRLHVTAEEGERDVIVTVVAPPAVAHAAP